MNEAMDWGSNGIYVNQNDLRNYSKNKKDGIIYEILVDIDDMEQSNLFGVFTVYREKIRSHSHCLSIGR